MAYSTTINQSGARKNNVLMTVFELACNESADILIFGTGYGCRPYGQTGPDPSESEFGHEYDADLIDQIVRGCMKLHGNLDVAFVVPHAHPDHTNPEFIKALNSLPGYTIDTIYVHTDDRAHLDQPGQACSGALAPCSCPTPCSPLPFDCWEEGIQVFGSADCCDGQNFQNCTGLEKLECEDAWLEGMLSFSTTLGRVWFRSRDGHTPGSVDLVLDHKSSTPESPRRFVIYGSMIPNCLNANNCVMGLCTPACLNPLPGLRWAIPAHGNIPFDLIPNPGCLPSLCSEDLSCE